MTKEEAREILNNWAYWRWDSFGNMALIFPVTDETVYIKQTDAEVIQYTFKHVIKIAYDL